MSLSLAKPWRILPITPGGHTDRILLSLAISLAAFGLVMVYSASYIYSQEKIGDGLFYFNKHLVFLSIGFLGMFTARFLDYRIWKKMAYPLLAVSVGLMVLTFVPGIGHRAGGSSRWLNLGGFSLQPIELAKLALVMVMARRLSAEGTDFSNWKTGFAYHLWPAVLLVGICLAQPDFGSSALILATVGFMLYLSGVRLKYLLISMAAVIPFLGAAIAAAPYRVARFLTFLDPWADPQGAGFQIIQSFIAFYRGSLFGVGLGNSRAKVFYLPEAHNDFIMSVVGEELGFVGVCLLSIAFLILIFRGIRAAAKADSPFAALLASGLTILVGLEVFWNAAIVLGMFPTKGMNMPFISSGGTSILCVLGITGILLNIAAQAKRDSR